MKIVTYKNEQLLKISFFDRLRILFFTKVKEVVNPGCFGGDDCYDGTCACQKEKNINLQKLTKAGFYNTDVVSILPFTTGCLYTWWVNPKTKQKVKVVQICGI